MAYGSVDPNINNMNPADRNSAAIKAGYTGWDDYNNNKGSTQSSGGFSGGGSSSGGANWEDIVKKTIAMQQQANQPAIASMQGQIPEIASQYTAQQANVTAKAQNLSDRYAALLKSIDAGQTKDTSAQTVITSNELGKRGLLPSSTLAQQEVQNAITPITDKYTGFRTNAALDQTSGQLDLQSLLNQLTSGQVSDTRAVNNAIAQLQSGAASQGISTGTQMYGQEQTRLANEAAAQAQQRQQDIANQIAQSQLANQTRQTNYDVGKPYSTTTTANTGNYYQTPQTQTNQVTYSLVSEPTKTATVWDPRGVSYATPKSTNPWANPTASYAK